MTFLTSFLIQKQRWRVYAVSQQELNDALGEPAKASHEGACFYKPDCAVLLRTSPSLDTVIHEITHAFWFTYGPQYSRIKDKHEQLAWFFGKHGHRIVTLAHKVKHELS